MNWTDKLELLKEKYWRGETSLEEESLLRNHYLNSGEMDVEAIYFQYLEEEKTISLAPPKNKKGIIKMISRHITAIAAGLAIVLASFFVINQSVERANTESRVLEAQSPEEALIIAQSAFAIINDNLQHGNTMVKTNLDQFDKILLFN